MKYIFKTDKVIKITSYILVIIILILAVSLIPLSIVSHQNINDTVFVNHCGLSQDNYFKLFNENLVHNNMFSFPSNAIEIKADDYFSLKSGSSKLKIEELKIFAKILEIITKQKS